MKAILKFIDDFGGNSALVLAVFGTAIIVAVFQIFDLASTRVFGFVFLTAPIWLPFVTFLLFYETWLQYVQKHFDLAQGRVTLEIKIPQEVFKSPEAMELVLTQLHQTASPDNHVQTYWDGKHPPVYGLELVSRGGDVRFYMNVPRKKFKNLAEVQLYAQYPGIEVVELPIDYTAEIPWDPDRFAYFSLHFGLTKPDAYPIKTYFDYGLNTMPKEEEKIDPITSMLEMLGSIGPGEYYWVQIMISANRETNFKKGSLGTKPDWRSAAKAEIKKIFEEAAARIGSDQLNPMQLTDAEKQIVTSIERSLSKNAFDTAIRGMYIAKKDTFNPGERIGALITGWRSYDDLNRNNIGPLWRTDFDWNWWQDPRDKKKQAMKKQELEEYKTRSYTQQGGKDGKKVLTTEELATIFHIPGKVVATPTLGRIPSTRSEAPSNLPTG